MISARSFITTLCVAQLGWAPSAFAAAQTLDDLLQSVRNARTEEQSLNAEREQQFKARRDKQAQLLKEARANRDALEEKSKQLSAKYDANDKEINSLNQLLQQRQGNLGELFGVTRQVAGDVAGALSSSMITAEFPDREDFFVKIASTKTLPNIGELERMWFEMTREMTESGQVVRFPTQVAQPDGKSKEAEVVRIGPFIAVTAGGKYVLYQPSMKQFAVLSRQPPSKFVAAGKRVFNAQSGYVEGGVDPSRGVLLSLSVERPTVIERIQKGEFVGYIIISVGIIGALLALFQFFYLFTSRIKVRKQLKNLDHPTADNPVGRVLMAFKGDGSHIEEDAEVAELRISEAVLREVPKLERFQAFLRLAVAAGPLLGLIGTVIGMIITFQSITESGSSDPKLMATGIGQAMIATVLGLGIAIPLLFVNAGLTALSRGVVQLLDEQSAGLLAESIEKRKNGSRKSA